jgi:hypothetical protein
MYYTINHSPLADVVLKCLRCLDSIKVAICKLLFCQYQINFVCLCGKSLVSSKNKVWSKFKITIKHTAHLFFLRLQKENH